MLRKDVLVVFFSHSSHGIKAGSFSLFSYLMISLLLVQVCTLLSSPHSQSKSHSFLHRKSRLLTNYVDWVPMGVHRIMM